MAETQGTTNRGADEAAINELYERWRAAWLKVDAKNMVALFDPAYDGLMYQSEENPEAITRYSDLVQYWNNATQILTGIPEWRELKKKVAFLGVDSAAIWVLLDTKLHLNVSPKQELGGKLRAVLGLRKAQGKWSIANYHESRHFLMAPDNNGIFSYNIDHTKKILG
jgi:uncharacterized protein (TIGR02246 family)